MVYCSRPPTHPRPKSCRPDHVKVTIYAPKGVFAEASFKQCRKTVGQRREILPWGYYLWRCSAIKGTERESVSFEAQRGTEVVISASAQPYVITKVTVDGKTLPIEEGGGGGIGGFGRPSPSARGVRVRFTVNDDTTVRVHIGRPPVGEDWPEEWKGDWSGVSISPITEVKPLMEKILGRPLTPDERRELECCTWWGGMRLLKECQGYRPKSLPHVVKNPKAYIQRVAVESHLPDWSSVSFLSYCGRPLMVLSSESLDIKPGTKMRLIFPLLATFKKPYGWAQLYWGSLDFKYGEPAMGTAERVTKTVVSVTTLLPTPPPPPPPPPECEEGDTKCIGYDLYKCIEGKWVLVERNSVSCGYKPPGPPTPPGMPTSYLLIAGAVAGAVVFLALYMIRKG